MVEAGPRLATRRPGTLGAKFQVTVRILAARPRRRIALVPGVLIARANPSLNPNNQP